MHAHAQKVAQFGVVEGGADLTRAAALAALRDVQREMHAWTPPATRWSHASLWPIAQELDRRRVNALVVLASLGRRDTLGLVDAKRGEIELADGRPLALCLGTRKRSIRVVTANGPLHVAAAGCLAVFDDSLATTGGPSMWARWCPACEARKPRRDQERRLQAQIAARRFPGIRRAGRPFTPALEPD